MFRQFRLVALSSLLCINLLACGGGGEEPIEEAPKITASKPVINNLGPFMPVGFYSVNDSGIVQIDENYLNYGLVSKGSGVVSGNNAFSVSVGSSVAPILCIRPSQETIAIMDFVLNVGGTSTWNLTTDYGRSAPFEYWVFDAERLGTESGPGMVVYNAVGKLVYSTSTAEMRIIGQVTTPAFPYSWGESNPGAPGPSYHGIPANTAVCVNSAKSYFMSTNGAMTPSRLLVEGVRFSGNTLVVKNVNAGNGPMLGNDNGDWPLNNAMSSFLLIDVSDI